MPPRGPEWEFYLRDDKKKNSRNYLVWCRWCLEHEKQQITEKDSSLQGELTAAQQEELLQRAKDAFNDDHKGRFVSKREPMINHIIECERASEVDREKARVLKKAMKGEGEIRVARGYTIGGPTFSDDLSFLDAMFMEPLPAAPQDTVQSKIPWTLSRDLGMTKAEAEKFALQLTRMTISAGLHETWIEDPETIKMFKMIRAGAVASLPSRKQIGGRFLQILCHGYARTWKSPSSRNE
jgi:hypothetical protein